MVYWNKVRRELIQIQQHSFSVHYTQSILLGAWDGHQDNWQSLPSKWLVFGRKLAKLYKGD